MSFSPNPATAIMISVFVVALFSMLYGGSHIEIGDFLTSGRHGPQHAELLRLIGTLVGLRSDA